MINSLTPLQNWMETIHTHIQNKAILKARMAALVIPIFSALTVLSLFKSFCFRGEPYDHQSLNEKLTSLCFLTWNIFFGAFSGVSDPIGNYQLQTYFGFTQVKRTKILDLSPIAPKNIASDSEKKEKNNLAKPQEVLSAAQEELAKKENLEKSPQTQKEKLQKSVEKKEPVPPSPDEIELVRSIKQEVVEDLLIQPKIDELTGMQLKTPLPVILPLPAQEIIERQSGDLEEPVKISAVIPPVKESEPIPAEIIKEKEPVKKEEQVVDNEEEPLNKKEMPVQQPIEEGEKEQGQPNDTELLEIIDPLVNLKSERQSEHLEDDISVIITSATHPLTEEIKHQEDKKVLQKQLQSIMDAKERIRREPPPANPIMKPEQGCDFSPISLLFGNLPATGTLKVKKMKQDKASEKKPALILEKSKRFNIDETVIDHLAASHHLFSHLNLSQLLTMRVNLTTIKTNIIDEKAIVKINKMIQELTKRENTLWIAEDYLKGRFTYTCQLAIHMMLKKIKSGEGLSNGADQSRLFRSTMPHDRIFTNMACYHFHDIAKQREFSIYDWYSILSSYLQNMPEEKRIVFQPFASVDSVEKTVLEMNKLSLENQVLVRELLLLLKTSGEKIWLQEDLQLKANKDKSIEEVRTKTLRNMLAVTPAICKLLCPLSENKKMFAGLTPEEEQEFADNNRNTTFLAEIIELMQLEDA